MTDQTKQANLGLTDGEYGDLKVLNGQVVKNRRIVVQPFGKQVFIDVAARNTTSTDTHAFLDALAASASKLGLGVRYIDDRLTTFFDPKARYAEFVKTGETNGIELTDEEREALKLVEGIRGKFDAAFTLPEAPKAPYVRVTVAEDENPLRRFTFRKGGVSNGSYSLSNKQIEKAWAAARELWRNHPETTGSRLKYGAAYLRASGSSYRLDVYPSRIEIGCQSITRVQLEAIAERLGLEF